MRYFIPVAIALIVGLAAGFSGAFFDIGTDTSHLEVGLDNAEVESGPGVASLEIEGGKVFEFGSMEVGATGHHIFLFRSTGSKPLELNVQSTTCKCTVGTLERDTVPPGETVEVRMEWRPPAFSENFRQTATIVTNDPNNREIRLTVEGRVDIALRAIPSTLPLDRVRANEGHSVSTKVYGFREGGFEITGQRWLRSDIAEHFETEIRPLTEEELAEVIGAHSGYLVTLTLQPGMPLGAFHQTLELTTDVEGVDPVNIELSGDLVGDITLIGPEALDASNGLLKLDLVRSSQGRKVTIFVIVKGPYREDVDLQVGVIDPEGVLQASLGEPVSLNNGQIYRYPLEISIPEGAPSVNRLGGSTGSLGSIRLESGHEQLPSLILRVRFAVEE